MRFGHKRRRLNRFQPDCMERSGALQGRQAVKR